MGAVPVARPASGAGTGAGPAEYPRDELWDALREVGDPEMGISLVDMGMIVAIQRSGERAEVTLTYTAMGCPAMDMIHDDINERLLRVPGVREVAIDDVWEPVWTKARLTQEGRDELLALGVAV